MTTQRYSVTPHPIETLLTWVKSGEIAIPEIQRPFVWKATKVRNLLDSLYQGYPVGYLISWRNPTVKLKDGAGDPVSGTVSVTDSAGREMSGLFGMQDMQAHKVGAVIITSRLSAMLLKVSL